VVVVIVLGTALAAWIIVAVTRPLRVLSDEVATAAHEGFSAAALAPAAFAPSEHADDEFGRLRSGFHMLLAKLRAQWDELRRLDHFRRESVSNLSHDLRSPLTATVACLETLEQRWAGDSGRDEDRRLVMVALRNTANAVQMVRSLGDLALLDEPELKFTPSGGRVVLRAALVGDQIEVSVSDSGAGIPAHDIPHLFDRHYQRRDSVAPATSDEGKGLGLAIVKRIIELHQGTVTVASAPGAGTTVTIRLSA
jgi:signal transduction histidine kinase